MVLTIIKLKYPNNYLKEYMLVFLIEQLEIKYLTFSNAY